MRTTLGTLSVAAMLTLVSPAPASAAPKDVEATLEDAVTHAKLRGLLLDKLGSDGLRINIDVNGSHVRLSGEVEKKSSRELAKEVVLSAKGVRDVDNQLTFRTEVKSGTAGHAESEVKDAVLESKVKGRLLADVGKNALDIEVEATDGVVSLRGVVKSSSVKDQALATARSTEGVKKVVDLLKNA